MTCLLWKLPTKHLKPIWYYHIEVVLGFQQACTSTFVPHGSTSVKFMLLCSSEPQSPPTVGNPPTSSAFDHSSHHHGATVWDCYLSMLKIEKTSRHGGVRFMNVEHPDFVPPTHHDCLQYLLVILWHAKYHQRDKHPPGLMGAKCSQGQARPKHCWLGE